MAYIVKADFTAYSPNTAVDDDAEFAELAERASDIIDMITLNRISRLGGMSELAASVQAKIKKAVCAEVKMLYDNGGIEAVTGNGSVEKSASVGDYSYTLADGSAPRTLYGMPIAPMVETYLMFTGLMYAGVSVR